MTITRRLFNAGLAASAAAPFALLAAAVARAEKEAAHSMSPELEELLGGRREGHLALLLYPQFTALDVFGPHHMFINLWGEKTHLVAKRADPVPTDTGVLIQPTTTFADCPEDLLVICVPGGTLGTLAAMQDEETLAFLQDRASRARWVTSVCTGSLVLGAAGLLQGYRATSHWLTHDILPELGAIPVKDRVVTDRNRITGGGVTAGIDFGLSIIEALRGRAYAEMVQLFAEYAPAPPFDAGTPETAPPEATAILTEMFESFLVDTRAVAQTAMTRL